MLTQNGKELYDYLFNPSALQLEDTPAPQDDPMGVEGPSSSHAPMEVEPAPFSQLVSEFVNVSASFDECRHLNARNPTR